MRLVRIEIANYLSIKGFNIELDKSCLILVGKNESGKSNILRALGHLDPTRLPTANEIRQNLPTEDDGGESYIRFVFHLSEAERDEFNANFGENFISADPSQPLIILKDVGVSASEVALKSNEILFITNFKELRKSFSIWRPNGIIADGWWEKLPECPPGLMIEDGDQQIPIGDNKYVHESLGPILENYFKPATFESISGLMISQVASQFTALLPTVLTWQYDANLLLPSEINLLEFAKNPDMCPPLKNMFLLAGSDDISARIKEAETRGKQALRNLLNSVAIKTTEHLASIWSDYSNVQVELPLDGPNIEPIITERNGFDIQQRSEGFKRFICFLLQISFRVHSNQLQNNLILIDEPENGLHPSSANDLRDELLRISESNLVVYSTHSIFMIDSTNIERHLIIKKEDEISQLLYAKDSEFAEEEMIFRALGHSVFNSLNESNVIFEGWKDKKLFQVFTAKLPKAQRDKLVKVGQCHANGVSSLRMMSPIFELTKRKMVIVSDGDDPAKQEQKKFKQVKMSGTWHTYQDLDPTITSLTGEDFLTEDYLSTNYNAHFKKLGFEELEPSAVPEFGKLKFLEDRLHAAGLSREDSKKEITTLKDRLFNNLKFKDIDPKYSKVVDGILALFE